MITLAGASLAVLGALHQAAAQTVHVSQPENWTAWAALDVQWAFEAPHEDDWVGAFLLEFPATYIKWWPVSASPEWPATDGTLQFELLNGRQPYVFRYFRGDDALAESEQVFPLGATPSQGHLAFVPGRPDRVTLSWVTNATGDDNQVALFGPSPDNLSSSAAAVASTYSAADFAACLGTDPVPPRTEAFANLSLHDIRCGYDCYEEPTAQELWLDPGILHTATLVLTSDGAAPPPGARFYYSFGDAAGGGEGLMSPTFSFAAPRAAGDPSAFTFLVTADAGIGAVPAEERGGATHNDPPVNGADSVVAAMLADPATPGDEFLLLNGDISYARGWAWIWERYMDQVQPLTTQLPFMVGVGNHEVDSAANANPLARGRDSGGECGVATAARFPYFNGDPSVTMWYAFSHGLVHVVVLSSEHLAAPQQAFFEADMAAVNRTVTPWVVVLLHRPLFSSEARDANGMALALEWHGVFVGWGVDLVLTGHQHFYERLCAVEAVEEAQGCSATRDRPVYVVDGSAGAEFSPTADDRGPSPLTEYRDFSAWGYSRVAVSAAALTLRHYHTDGSAEAVDEVTLPAVAY